MVGNDAVVAGEGQVVQLRVRAEHDALRQRIDRAGMVERLREGRALAVSAADVAIPCVAMVADADRVATVQVADRGVLAVGDVRGRAIADEVVHLVEVEHHVVRAVASTVDGLVDVLGHQINDALVVRHVDLQVAHIDRRRLRCRRGLIGNAHINGDGRVAGVVVRVDIAVRIVVRVAVAVQVAVDVRVVRALGLTLMLALALTLALQLGLQFGLALQLRLELPLRIVVVVAWWLVGVLHDALPLWKQHRNSSGHSLIFSVDE